MLITVQLLQIARGLTTYEAMTPHKHKHSSPLASEVTSFVTTGDPSISAAGLGPNNRGPDPAVETAHAHSHKGGFLETWKRLLGIDTFVAVALHGRGAPSGPNSGAVSHSHKNPFSRGCFGNCQDFWMDEGPWFGSRESGRATFGGERVDYTSMYDVPSVGNGRGYVSVSGGDGEA
jgi:palmitoyltransferase ZDHHC13/17